VELEIGGITCEVEKTGYTAALPAPKKPAPGAAPGGDDGASSDPELTSLGNRLIVSIALTVPVTRSRVPR